MLVNLNARVVGTPDAGVKANMAMKFEFMLLGKNASFKKFVFDDLLNSIAYRDFTDHVVLEKGSKLGYCGVLSC